MAEEFDECLSGLKRSTELATSVDDNIRLKFCSSLVSEKKREYTFAMTGYIACIHDVSTYIHGQEQQLTQLISDVRCDTRDRSGDQLLTEEARMLNHIASMKELKGEILLRIAVLRKETGAWEQAMVTCTSMIGDSFSDNIRANALCLKGLLHEMQSEFPAAEIVYRSALQMLPGHSIALERLGRVYLRYRETIPAAVQCFFKSVETNPSNHMAWYLLGRCYMATAQYSDACEAYNRAVNLNPNDPQIWCSLGVLYYAFGQYREALGMLARALKLDPTMADAWYNVGALYDMCDQSEDAQQAYIKAREHGLADRFARAGMGFNPMAISSLNSANGSHATPSTNVPTASSSSAISLSSRSQVSEKAQAPVAVKAENYQYVHQLQQNFSPQIHQNMSYQQQQEQAIRMHMQQQMMQQQIAQQQIIHDHADRELHDQQYQQMSGMRDTQHKPFNPVSQVDQMLRSHRSQQMIGTDYDDINCSLVAFDSNAWEEKTR